MAATKPPATPPISSVRLEDVSVALSEFERGVSDSEHGGGVQMKAGRRRIRASALIARPSLALVILGITCSGSAMAVPTATLQPVQVCQNDGSACWSAQFDTAVFQGVFDQAGITIAVLPSIQLNDTTFWSFNSPVTQQALFALPAPDGVLVNYFTMGSSIGLSAVGNPNSFLGQQGTSGIPDDVHARFLARLVGLSIGNFGAVVEDPLNLFCSSSICDIGNSLFGEISDEQAAGLLGSSFVSDVPEPGTLTLFGVGLLGIGLARRIPSTASCEHSDHHHPAA